MIVETGTITAINDGWLVVSTRAMSACGGCSANGKCGQNLWARFFGADIATDLHIEYSPGQTEELHLGDLVEIGLEEMALLKTSLVSYGAPLRAWLPVRSAWRPMENLQRPQRHWLD